MKGVFCVNCTHYEVCYVRNQLEEIISNAGVFGINGLTAVRAAIAANCRRYQEREDKEVTTEPKKLRDLIADAQRQLDTWPEWMRKAGHFEGADAEPKKEPKKLRDLIADTQSGWSRRPPWEEDADV